MPTTRARAEVGPARKKWLVHDMHRERPLLSDLILHLPNTTYPDADPWPVFARRG